MFIVPLSESYSFDESPAWLSVFLGSNGMRWWCCVCVVGGVVDGVSGGGGCQLVRCEGYFFWYVCVPFQEARVSIFCVWEREKSMRDMSWSMQSPAVRTHIMLVLCQLYVQIYLFQRYCTPIYQKIIKLRYGNIPGNVLI